MMRAPRHYQHIILASVEETPRPTHLGRVAVLADAAKGEMSTAGVGGEKVAQADKVVVCWDEKEDAGAVVGDG